jgi:hypothetical protein
MGQEVSHEDYIDLHNRPNFEIVHLEPFTDADIQAVLKARFLHQWETYWEQIQHIYHLPDLARRPVLLDIIARTLPELKEGQTVNAARLYQVYTDFWLEREAAKGHTLITPADRRLFAENLAMEMLHTGELAIHYSCIPARVKAYFRLDKAEEIDYFEADVRTCSFLSRDEDGSYAFAHKSFMEFFAANHLHRLMLEDKATTNGPVHINEEIRRFLTDLFVLVPKQEPGPPYPPPEGFVWVPPGEFIFGGEYGLDAQITRLHEGFFAAKTPVTNAQYSRFIIETGYPPPKHWHDKRPPENLADHPVVYISWDDAVAYAKWAGARLPTEQEWEKAARGYDGREYPWGEWAEGRCNSREASLGETSPVGRFSPDGDSPYGLQDAVGNVWEWTVSYTEVKSKVCRVVCGDSFADLRGHIPCEYRRPYDLNFVWTDIGFRVVISRAPAETGKE